MYLLKFIPTFLVQIRIISLCQSFESIHNPLEETFTISSERILVTQWSTVRIFPDFTYFLGNHAYNSTYSYIQETLIPGLINYLEATLQIQQQFQNYTISTITQTICTLQTPTSYFSGVAADLVIFLTVTYQSNQNLVTGTPCLYDPITGRPNFIMLNFNSEIVSSSIDWFQVNEDLISVIHEVIHSIALYKSLFSTYINPNNGQVLTSTTTTVSVNSETITVLAIEPLTSYLQTYFNCTTLSGAYLENQGNTSDPRVHWERRIFMNEAMTAGKIANKKISNITLNFLQSTGWYLPNYDMADTFTFGQNEGCSFISGPCINSATHGSNYPSLYCSSLEGQGCTLDNLEKAYCGTNTTPPTNLSLYAGFNYYGGDQIVNDLYSDNCAYYVPYTGANCESQYDGIGTERTLVAETFGTGSRCFMSQIGVTTIPSSAIPLCFQKYCTISGTSWTLVVTIAEINFTCTTTGQTITPPSPYVGTFICPNPTTFCQNSGSLQCPRGCMGKGTCQSGTCNCNTGWSSVDCSYSIVPVTYSFPYVGPNGEQSSSSGSNGARISSIVIGCIIAAGTLIIVFILFKYYQYKEDHDVPSNGNPMKTKNQPEVIQTEESMINLNHNISKNQLLGNKKNIFHERPSMIGK